MQVLQVETKLPRKYLSSYHQVKLENLMKIVGLLSEKSEMTNTKISLLERLEDKDG
jgi:hypothetical protein